MKRSLRISLALTMALAVGLWAASAAWATVVGSDEETTLFSGGMVPNVQSATTAGNEALHAQVTTTENASAPTTDSVPDQGVEQAFLAFPSEAKITTAHLPKCTATDATLAGDTTAQAIADCGAGSVIGSGEARAMFAGFPADPLTGLNEVRFTVTAFNGPTSTASGGFLGGNPTVILFADNDLIGSAGHVPVRGEIINASADPLPNDAAPTPSGNFGKALWVPNAPDVAGDLGALTMFNSTIEKTWKAVVNGKKQTFHYVTAKCTNENATTPGSGEWSFYAAVGYDDNVQTTTVSVDRDGFNQDCAVK